MNVAGVMREQNYRDRFGDFPRIIFRSFTAQNIDAKRNHVDDVPLAAAGLAIGVLFQIENRHVGVMKPMVRWSRRTAILGRRIRLPKLAQLLVDLRVIGVARKRIWVVYAV